MSAAAEAPAEVPTEPSTEEPRQPARVLFSPVGDSDPMREYHDASMLHVARHYQPDCIVLYLTAKMSEYEDGDHRYTGALQLLGIPEASIRLISRPELSAAHEYDFFIREFRDILIGLHTECPGSELILNVTSGTPAMKSALVVLNALHEFPMTAVQVASPLGMSNRDAEYYNDISIAEQWELNEDNSGEAPSRCSEVKSPHLNVLLKCETIQALVSSYDYQGALQVALGIEDYLPPKVVGLLKGLVARLELRTGKAYALLGTNLSREYLGDPIGCGPIYEYLQYLKVLSCRREWASFLRAISPAVTRIFLEATDAYTPYKQEDYLENPAATGMKLDFDKIEGDDILSRVFRVSDASRSRLPYLTDTDLSLLITEFDKNQEIKRLVRDAQKLRESRNNFAHDIKPVEENAEQVYKLQEFLGILQRLLSKVAAKNGETLPPWDSYKRLNEHVIGLLDTCNVGQ
jgi:CRISPR type III-A/MTUBE-associated protein Csm6